MTQIESTCDSHYGYENARIRTSLMRRAMIGGFRRSIRSIVFVSAIVRFFIHQITALPRSLTETIGFSKSRVVSRLVSRLISLELLER
jgi:hypothetical protein